MTEITMERREALRELTEGREFVTVMTANLRALLILADERDRLAAVVNRMVMEKSAPADIDPLADPNKLSIAYGMLVYETGRHNCAGGDIASGYAHEPGCGYEPVLQLDTLEGWPGEPAEAEAPVPMTQEEKIAYLRQLAEEFNTEDAIIETALGGAAYVRNVLLTEAEKLEETAQAIEKNLEIQ